MFTNVTAHNNAEINFNWDRYNIIVSSNDTNLGEAKITRMDPSYESVCEVDNYIHGEVLKLGVNYFNNGGLLKWQKLDGSNYEDITVIETNLCML